MAVSIADKGPSRKAIRLSGHGCAAAEVKQGVYMAALVVSSRGAGAQGRKALWRVAVRLSWPDEHSCLRHAAVLQGILAGAACCGWLLRELGALGNGASIWQVGLGWTAALSMKGFSSTTCAGRLWLGVHCCLYLTWGPLARLHGCLSCANRLSDKALLAGGTRLVCLAAWAAGGLGAWGHSALSQMGGSCRLDRCGPCGRPGMHSLRCGWQRRGPHQSMARAGPVETNGQVAVELTAVILIESCTMSSVCPALCVMQAEVRRRQASEHSRTSAAEEEVQERRLKLEELRDHLHRVRVAEQQPC